MAKFNLGNNRAEGNAYCGGIQSVSIIFDFKSTGFAAEVIEAKTTADALAAFDVYEAKAKASGLSLAVFCHLARGERSPNGFGKLPQSTTCRYVNIVYPDAPPAAPAPIETAAETAARLAPDAAPAITKEVKPYTVGDVLESSWGYDQTNYDFYEVTAVKGKTIVVRMLEQDSTPSPHNFMVGTCTPKPGVYKAGEPEHTKRPSSPGASFKMESWGRWVRHWDGTVKNWTAYA